MCGFVSQIKTVCLSVLRPWLRLRPSVRARSKHRKLHHFTVQGTAREMSSDASASSSTDDNWNFTDAAIPSLVVLGFLASTGSRPSPTHPTTRLVNYLYNKLGAKGLLMLPVCSLTMEKIGYDTFTAYHGRDIYEERRKSGKNPHGEFPSGGSALPSWSLIAVRKPKGEGEEHGRS